MALDSNIRGVTSGTGAEVSTNNQLLVNLPTTSSQAGFAQIAYNPASTINKELLVTDEGSIGVALPIQLFEQQWNSASTAWNSKFGTNATTLTKAVVNGFMVLNSAAATTTTTGISLYSTRVFNLEEARELNCRFYAKHLNMAASNKQVDLGLGYYAFAAGQAAAMNEFIGFRWTTTGGLQAVVETSQGGAPTSQTVNINGNVPYSDNVAREYQVVINESNAAFYVAGVWVASIARDPGSWALLKGISLPFIARGFNSGAASLGWTFSLGEISIIKYSSESSTLSILAAGQGKSSYYAQPDVLAAATAPHVFPASGTAPTAAAGSNTASAFNAVTALGGFYRNTLTGVVLAVHTNVLVTGFQNPAIPTAAGVATNSRNFIITGISISPMVVSTALTGGGFTAIWFATIGSTAISLATTSADGTTAVATKAPALIPLNLVSTLAATAAAGVVSTDVGDHQYTFPTPLVLAPGECLDIGFRTIVVTAAITAGAADGTISVNGYWE